MESPEEEEDWQRTQAYLQAAGERLVQAGWASRVVHSPQGASLELTGKGIDGMDHLFQALADLDPHTMQAEHIMGLFLFLTLRDEDKPQSPAE